MSGNDSHRPAKELYLHKKTNIKPYMGNNNWSDEFSVAITVSDTDGNILYMNDKSGKTFSKYGGKELIGTNLSNCHKPESWEMITDIMKNNKTNCYTIEKEGIKKLIYQAPWYNNGQPAGLVELSMEIPFVMDHFIRK